MSDWSAEPRPGLMHRLLIPGEAARSRSLGTWLGLLAGAAFIGSVTFDWRTLTLDLSGPSDQESATQETVFRAGVADATSMGTAYLLGLVGLLALVGTVVARPELAARFRHAVTGAGIGLIGVVLGIFTRHADLQSALGVNYGGFVPGIENRVKASWGLGGAFGLAAIALAVAAVWVAARHADRTETLRLRLGGPPPVDRGPEPAVPEPAPLSGVDPSHNGYRPASGPIDLQVRPAGATDITVTPDPSWRRPGDERGR